MVFPRKKRKYIEKDLRYNHVHPDLRKVLDDSDTSSDESYGFNHNAKGTFGKQNSLETVNEIVEDSTFVLHDRHIEGHGQPEIEQNKITKTGLLSSEEYRSSPKKRAMSTGMGKSGGQHAFTNNHLEDSDTTSDENYGFNHSAKGTFEIQNSLATVNEIVEDSTSMLHDRHIEGHEQPGIEQNKITKTGLLSSEECRSSPKKRAMNTGMGKSGGQRALTNILQTRIQESYHDKANRQIHTAPKDVRASKDDMHESDNDENVDSCIEIYTDMSHKSSTERLILNVKTPNEKIAAEEANLGDTTESDTEHIKKYRKQSPVETNGPIGLSNYQAAIELFLEERSSHSDFIAMDKNSPNRKFAVRNDGKASRRVPDGDLSKKKRKKNGSSQKTTRKRPKHSFTKDSPPALEDEGYHPALKPVQNYETCESCLPGFNNHRHGEHSKHEQAFKRTNSFVREGCEDGNDRLRHIANTEAVALNKENVPPNTPAGRKEVNTELNTKKHVFDRRITPEVEAVYNDKTLCATMKNGEEDQYLLPSSHQVAEISSVLDVANLGMNRIQQKDREVIPTDFEKEPQFDCQQDCSSKSSRDTLLDDERDCTLQTSHATNASNLMVGFEDIIHADGIILVSGVNDDRRSILHPWPARILSQQENKIQRKLFRKRGQTIPKGFVGVYYFFPCWGDHSTALLRPAAIDNWFYFDFVDPSNLVRFSDEEFDLDYFSSDIVDRFQKGWTIAAGLKFWALGAGLTSPNTQPKKFNQFVADYGSVVDIEWERWIEISQTYDPENIVKMISDRVSSVYDETKSKALRKNLGMAFREFVRDKVSPTHQHDAASDEVTITKEEAEESSTLLAYHQTIKDSAEDVKVKTAAVEEYFSMKTENEVSALDLKEVRAIGLAYLKESVSEESRTLFMELAHIKENPSFLLVKLVQRIEDLNNQLHDP